MQPWHLLKSQGRKPNPGSRTTEMLKIRYLNTWLDFNLGFSPCPHLFWLLFHTVPSLLFLKWLGESLLTCLAFWFFNFLQIQETGSAIKSIISCHGALSTSCIAHWLWLIFSEGTENQRGLGTHIFFLHNHVFNKVGLSALLLVLFLQVPALLSICMAVKTITRQEPG